MALLNSCKWWMRAAALQGRVEVALGWRCRRVGGEGEAVIWHYASVLNAGMRAAAAVALQGRVQVAWGVAVARVGGEGEGVTGGITQ